MSRTNPSRRSFLATAGTAAAAGMAALSPMGRLAAAASAKNLNLGVQLFSLRGYKVDEALKHASDLGFKFVEFYPGMYPTNSDDAAIAAIGRNRMNWSSRDGVKPRRCQNAAASSSTALTMSARPPTRPATVTQRSRACLIRPVPTPRPAQDRSVASWPSSRHGTGSGGCPVRMARGKALGTTAVGARP